MLYCSREAGEFGVDGTGVRLDIGTRPVRRFVVIVFIMPSEDPNLQSTSDPQWEQTLEEVERSLGELKARYAQVQRDRQRQTHLKQRQQQLATELKHLQAQLEALEIELESRLFSWKTLREPFWQAVRFAGIGVLVGWLLKSCTG